MVLRLIKLEVIHFREYHLICIKSNSEFLANVKVSWVFEEILLLPSDSLFFSFKILDLSAFNIYYCFFGLRRAAGAFVIIRIVCLIPFFRTAFEHCPLRATSFIRLLLQCRVRCREALFQNLDTLSGICKLTHNIFCECSFKTVKERN